MAVTDAPITSYSDTTAHRRAISDYISLIDPDDTPVVSYFGLNGSPEAFRIVNWPHTKIEWLEDSLADLTDALNGSITSNATTITVVDGSLFKKGHIIEIDSEMMWVSGIAAQVVTVTRNYSGTQATHADAAVTTIISQARLEGEDADYDSKTDVTAPYNYTQIFEGGVEVTRTQRQLMQYGISDEFDYQAAKKIPELSRLIEKSFFRGVRGAGSATTPRGMGGLETFITTNTSSISAALTSKHITDEAQSIWEAGGKPNLLICNGWVKRKINSFYEGMVRTSRDESRGGVLISEIETDFGLLKVLMSRWCETSKLYLLTEEHVGMLTYYPFSFHDVAYTGDADRGEVVGEFSMAVRHDTAHALISGISTTS